MCSVPPITIRIFLADGTPAGLRVVERSNWTGRALDFARADWARIRGRADFLRPGVYLLRGMGEDGVDRIYIGEADQLASRLAQHFSGPSAKDFWTRAIAFTSKDENLNKAHVRYLESRLLDLARSAKRVRIENGTLPAPPSLSEADRAETDAFLDEMLVIFPLVGVDAFERGERSPAAPKLRLNARGVTATGSDTAEGFLVHKGSGVSATETPSVPLSIVKMRRRLRADGVIAETRDGLRMTQDYLFTSPSTAADIVLGRSSNGRLVWKDEGGRTLKELQEAEAGSAEPSE